MHQIIKTFVICSLLCSLLACVSNSSTINSNAANYNVELGLGYFKQGDVARAKYKLLLALQQAPNDPIAQDAMAYFLDQTGATAQAEKYYLNAVALAPAAGIPQNNYGTFLCRHGRYNEAITHFIKAVGDPQYLNPARAYENAGLCAIKIPNPELATTYFQQAITNDPKRAMALLELAKLSYNRGQYSMAKSYLTRYLQVAPPTRTTQQLAKELAEH